MENMEQKPVQPIELPEAEEKMELEQTGHAGTEKKMVVESRVEVTSRMEKEAKDYARSRAEDARTKIEFDRRYAEAYGEKIQELERAQKQKDRFREELPEEERKAA